MTDHAETPNRTGSQTSARRALLEMARAPASDPTDYDVVVAIAR
jgi:hypothetical protein